MWATLAIASALSLAPAQAGKLEIKRDRVTYGILGQERKDTKLLAGDVFVVTFDIEGLQVKDDGRVRYSMGMELRNMQTGKAEFTKDPQELEVTNALGGSRLPAFAMSNIGLDTQPGKYKMIVTVNDLLATQKSSTKLERDFEVVAPKFGLVQVALFNQAGLPAPPIAVVGQTIVVNAAAVGFELDKEMQPDLAFELRVLDQAGRPTVAKPFTGEANKAVPKQNLRLLPLQFTLPLNRSGKFTIELKATDKVSKKEATQTLALEVIEPQ
jgi:hypothetical protein